MQKRQIREVNHKEKQQNRNGKCPRLRECRTCLAMFKDLQVPKRHTVPTHRKLAVLWTATPSIQFPTNRKQPQQQEVPQAVSSHQLHCRKMQNSDSKAANSQGSSRGADIKKSQAVMPCVWSKRKSSGPSAWLHFDNDIEATLKNRS